MEVFAFIGIAVAAFIALWTVSMLRNFRDHMKVVRHINLTRDEGFALSELSNYFEARTRRRMPLDRRMGMGITIQSMGPAFVAAVNTKQIDEPTAIALLGAEARLMGADPLELSQPVRSG